MAKIKGLYLGVALSALSAGLVRSVYSGAELQNLVSDTAELSATPVSDVISLGVFSVDARIHPDSLIYTDALGASTTLSIGDATYPAALAAAASTASAGNRSVIASVNIADYFKPLWQQLGYASRQAAVAANSQGIELLATIGGAAATGTVTWLIKGHAN